MFSLLWARSARERTKLFVPYFLLKMVFHSASNSHYPNSSTYLCHGVQSADAASNRLCSALSRGIGLRHLSVEQGYLKTSTLLRYLRQHSRLGQMSGQQFSRLKTQQGTVSLYSPNPGGFFRFLAVSTSAETFQDSHPPPDTVPIVKHPL
jgi:hypothetical protein